MTVARVTLPDGKTLEVPLNSTCADVARKIGPRLAKDAIGCFWNGELCAMEARVAWNDFSPRLVPPSSSRNRGCSPTPIPK